VHSNKQSNNPSIDSSSAKNPARVPYSTKQDQRINLAVLVPIPAGYIGPNCDKRRSYKLRTMIAHVRTNQYQRDLVSNLSFILTVLIAVGIFYVLFGEKQPKTKVGRPSSAVDSSKETFILLLGTDERLFKTCFGDDDQWLPCEIKCMAEDCSASNLRSILYNSKKRPVSIVIQDDVEHPHWNLIQSYYAKGGFVAYFGIYGEYAAPARLSQALGFDWEFSGYTPSPLRSYQYRQEPDG